MQKVGVWLVFFLLGATLVFAAAPYDRNLGWHRLQQIMSNESLETYKSLDENLNSVVDRADRADTVGNLDGDASLGDGTTTAVLKVKGASTLWSAIDFYSGSTNMWGIGRAPSGDFYIDRFGIRRAFTINKTTLNVGIDTENPRQKLDVNGNIRSSADIIGGRLCIGSSSNCMSAIPSLSSSPNMIAKWTGTDALGSSSIFESGGRIGIATTSPQGTLEVESFGGTDAIGLHVDRSAGAANGASTTLKGIYVRQQSSNDASVNIGVDSVVYHNHGYGGSYGIRGEAHNIYGSPTHVYGPSVGVYGLGYLDDSNGPGMVIGVLGETMVNNNPAGHNGKSYAGYFDNKFTYGSQNYGVYITTSSSATGLFIDKSAGSGPNNVPTQKGIYVIQQSSNDATSSIGVESIARQNIGFGGNVGVKGVSEGNVYGHYGDGVGVYGIATQPEVNGPGRAVGVKGEVSAGGSGPNGVTYAGYFDNKATTGNNNYGIYLSTASAGNYGIYQNGGATNYFSGPITGPSDLRLKKDISPLTQSLEKLGKINGVSFAWKNSSDDSTHFGVIAQDIQKIYPELVGKNAQGYLTVNYDGLIPVLIEAVNELSEKVQNQDKVIQQQQQLIANQQIQINEIQDQR